MSAPAAQRPGPAQRAAWDITALLNAADPKAPRPERHLWLVRLVQWVRHGESTPPGGGTPRPVLRLKLLLNQLERHPAERARIVALLGRCWHEADLPGLLADFGFSSRRALAGAVVERLRLRWLPATPDTDDLGVLLRLMFDGRGDANWLAAIDPMTLNRLALLLADSRALADGVPAGAAPADGAPRDWRAPVLRAMTWLVAAVRASAFSPAIRRRMDPARVADQPFEQLARAVETLGTALAGPDQLAIAQAANYLRALLQHGRAAADSVHAHLEAHGVSLDLVFQVEQLLARLERLEQLTDLVLSDTPAPELHRLLVDLVRLAEDQRSVRAVVSEHYGLLARKVAEQHAETGEHYITRDRSEYRGMLKAAAGGGAVIAFTTFGKFFITALGMAPFWAGMAAGLNYALSFLVIHLAHWTVATKQPAMTAPALAERLAGLQADHVGDDDRAVRACVDEIAALVRSQVAGIAGNLAMVAPVVVAVQLLAWLVAGRPLTSEKEAQYVLHSITLLGPTAFFAAFTGVILFLGGQIAGWAENWFRYHRLASALAHHPGIVGALGAPGAARWARWWQGNLSGVVGNVALGLMLGLVPVLLAFVGLPIEVRHVTLSTGQLAAAASTLGWATLAEPAFWWCVAGLVVTGVLNLGVSFWLALQVAIRARGTTLRHRALLWRALWQRLRQQPGSFLWPPAKAG